MTQKKDRRSARTKKREEKDYLSSLTRKDFPFIQYASECRPLLKESNRQSHGVVIMGCEPHDPATTCYFGDCKPWFDMKWFKMPSWPRSHSSCPAMSPESCQ